MNTNTAELEPSSNQVQTGFHKLLILKELKKNRSPLLLDIGNGQQCVSVILDLCLAAGWCELDELSSEAEHQRLLNERKFVASARLSGVRLSFHSKVVSVNKHQGLYRYRVKIPNEINYFDKRSTHRIHIPLMNAPDAELSLSNSKMLKGKLRDLSQRGAAIEIDGQNVDISSIRREDRAQCVLKDQSGADITFNVEVRRIATTGNPANQRNPNSRKPKITKLGLQFEDLDRLAAARLRAYTSAIERQQARRY